MQKSHWQHAFQGSLMIARIHEELAVYEGSEEARQSQVQ